MTARIDLAVKLHPGVLLAPILVRGRRLRAHACRRMRSHAAAGSALHQAGSAHHTAAATGLARLPHATWFLPWRPGAVASPGQQAGVRANGTALQVGTLAGCGGRLLADIIRGGKLGGLPAGSNEWESPGYTFRCVCLPGLLGFGGGRRNLLNRYVLNSLLTGLVPLGVGGPAELITHQRCRGFNRGPTKMHGFGRSPLPSHPAPRPSTGPPSSQPPSTTLARTTSSCSAAPRRQAWCCCS
jgi:hypothetical protein